MANLWSKGEFGPEDFVPYFRRPAGRMSVREQRAAMQAAAARQRT